MNFTPTQLKIIAFSAAVARFSHPAWFNFLQNLHHNRPLPQELKHEEEVGVSSVSTRSPGRHPGWDKRSRTTLMIRALVQMLPEWVRQVLWRSLRDRYEDENAHPR